MVEKPEHWKQLAREQLLDTKFLKVYKDTVQLPTGDVLDDFTVATLPDGVVIVATDTEGRLITMFEYKYAIGRVILNLPSGGSDPGETPEEAATRELLEETGYASDDVELIQSLSEYPSKLTHTLHIVRIKNAQKVKEVAHEASESLSDVHLISTDMPDYGGVFDSTYTVAAIALTVPEFLKK